MQMEPVSQAVSLVQSLVQYPDGQSMRQRVLPLHGLLREQAWPTVPEPLGALEQMPALQVCVGVQRRSHAPQLAASVLRLTQVVPHIVCGNAQPLWQRPAAHVSPSGHGWLQRPQCAGLMLVSTQPPPHASRGAEHTTEPTSTAETSRAPTEGLPSFSTAA